MSFGDAYRSRLGYPSVGQWHQVIAMFQDGVAKGTSVVFDGRMGRPLTASFKGVNRRLDLNPHTTAAGTKKFILGGLSDQADPDQSFVGEIAYVRVFNKVLSGKEIRTAYEEFRDRRQPLPWTPEISLGDEVLANIRSDLERAGRSASFPSAGGKWSLFAASSLKRNAQTTPLTFVQQPKSSSVSGNSCIFTRDTHWVPGPAYLTTGTQQQLQLPGIRAGQLLLGAGETGPGFNEVAVHPGHRRSPLPVMLMRWTSSHMGPVQVAVTIDGGMLISRSTDRHVDSDAE